MRHGVSYLGRFTDKPEVAPGTSSAYNGLVARRSALGLVHKEI